MNELLDNLQRRLEKATGPIIFPLIVYFIASALLLGLARLHWMSGFVAALLFLAIVVWLFRGLNEKFYRKFEPAVVLSMLATLVGLGAATCGAFSYILHVKEWGGYEISPQLTQTVADFGLHYMWLLLDMIPGLDIWESIPVAAPLKPKNALAGVPILAFRLAVVIPILTTFAHWKEFRSSGSNTEATAGAGA